LGDGVRQHESSYPDSTYTTTQKQPIQPVLTISAFIISKVEPQQSPSPSGDMTIEVAGITKKDSRERQTGENFMIQ